MVVGGTDTSSNTIEFAMAEIMNKPEVMRKTQQELEAVVGKDNIVEESHIHKLPYLHAVMNIVEMTSIIFHLDLAEEYALEQQWLRGW